MTNHEKKLFYLGADYPDSDPEDTFDREEPDYDQCGFIHDAAADDADDESPSGAPGDEGHLADILRTTMKLKGEDGEEGDDEDEDEVNRWDIGSESMRVLCVDISCISFYSRHPTVVILQSSFYSCHSSYRMRIFGILYAEITKKSLAIISRSY